MPRSCAAQPCAKPHTGVGDRLTFTQTHMPGPPARPRAYHDCVRPTPHERSRLEEGTSRWHSHPGFPGSVDFTPECTITRLVLLGSHAQHGPVSPGRILHPLNVNLAILRRRAPPGGRPAGCGLSVPRWRSRADDEAPCRRRARRLRCGPRTGRQQTAAAADARATLDGMGRSCEPPICAALRSRAKGHDGPRS